MKNLLLEIVTIVLFPATFYICLDWIAKIVLTVGAKKNGESIKQRIWDLALEFPALIFFIAFFVIWNIH